MSGIVSILIFKHKIKIDSTNNKLISVDLLAIDSHLMIKKKKQIVSNDGYILWTMFLTTLNTSLDIYRSTEQFTRIYYYNSIKKNTIKHNAYTPQ